MSGPIFHVVNGDATLAVLRRAAVPGEAVVWPDMLMEGPLLRGKDGTLDWSARARYLSKAYGVDRKAAAARIRAFNRALDLASRSGGEVVFWFEEDFFCQVHLAYLLATLPKALRRPGRASVICPEKPLGLMKPRALEALFARRQAPGKGRLALASKAWKALSRPAAPSGVTGKGRISSATQAHPARAPLAALLSRADGFAAWPLLKRGLLARLDSLPDGDGRPGSLEYAIAEALVASDGGSAAFPDLFRAVSSHRRIKPLGLGDAQVARALLDMAARKDAPIRVLGTGRKPAPKAPLDFRDARIVLTEGARPGTR